MARTARIDSIFDLMIRLTQVAVRKYGNVFFKDLNWHIGHGEHWLVRGNNGVGKSGLLELIAGKLQPCEGTITYAFVNTEDDWETRFRCRSENVHYIPVQPLHSLLGFQPDLFYQQRYYSLGEERIPRVSDYFGSDVTRIESLKLPPSFDVNDLLDLELNRLSNGQIRKVTLIRQLLKHVPRFLLLDYPFEGLDAASRTDLCEFLDHLVEEFSIQLIITDHYHQLPRSMNRCVVVGKGGIVSTSDFVAAAPSVKKAVPAATPESGTPVVELRNITIRYGDREIIKDFNWRINKGDRWALTGKNGSGKTTLFSLIYADHPMAYSQNVFLFGRRRGTGESIWDIKKRISYFGPEQIHFLDHQQFEWRVNDFLVRGRAALAAKVDALIRYFELEAVASRHLYELSSGELQLVLLVQFFLTERELFLLDEPFQFLDPGQKARVNKYLADHLHEDSTLVLITHYESDITEWTRLRMRV